MALPIARITGDNGAGPLTTTIIAASALPLIVNLDSATSSVGTGFGATTFVPTWYLEKPPESAAVLSYPGALTARYTIDTPGTYQVRLSIIDDGSTPQTSEVFDVRVDPATAPYKFSAPSTAYYIVRAALPLTSLVIPTEGTRAWMESVRAIYPVLETLSGGLASVSGQAPRTRYVMAEAGSISADGSIGNPYNPTSATEEGFDGPWQQAIDALGDLDYTASPEHGAMIVAFGGEYDEDLTISAEVSWTLVTLGHVTFDVANAFAFSPVTAASILSQPDLRIVSGAGNAGFFNFPGALTLTNPDAAAWVVYLEQATLGSVGITGTMGLNCFLQTDASIITGACNVPNLRVLLATSTKFGGTLTCYQIGSMRHCSLASITLGNASTPTVDARNGFYNCGWTASSVFNTPAGAARFDQHTIEQFHTQECTFTGGAGHPDVLCREFTVVCPDVPLTITNVGASTNFITAAPFFDFIPYVGMALEISAVISAIVNAADSFKTSLTLTDQVGTIWDISNPAAAYVGGTFPIIDLFAEVTFTGVDAAGAFQTKWKAMRDGIVDEGVAYNTGVDFSPATVRINSRVVLAGTMGAASSAVLRRMTIRCIKGL